MNGNLTLIDNAKGAGGTHNGFTKLYNAAADMLSDCAALACYCLLLRRAGSEYSVTVQGLAKDLSISKSKASGAVKQLAAVGLLDIEAEKETRGAEMLETERGLVPNNCKRYIVYSVPKSAGQASAADFAAADKRPAKEETPPPMNSTPPAPPEQPKKQSSAAAEQRRQEICDISERQGLFGEAAQAKLVQWAGRYKSAVGVPAGNEQIKHMANLLSGDIKADLSGYIKQQQAAFKR